MIIALALAVLASSSSLPSHTVLPACRASQLSVTFGGDNRDFSGMSHAGTRLIVRNIGAGAGACRLPALPALRFEDAAHHPLAIVRQVPEGMHPGPVVPPVTIAPGAEATADLRWVSGDVYDGHHCVTAAEAFVTIGNKTYRQPFAGHFCSAVDTPASFTQTWLKTDATRTPAGSESSAGAR